MSNDLIERDKVMHEIDRLSHAWEYGRAVDDCYEIVKKAPTVDAIPVEWIKQFIKKENIDIIHKVGIVYMVEQWKLHRIDFEISSEKRNHWIIYPFTLEYDSTADEDDVVCSNCKGTVELITLTTKKLYKYCPLCGAKMDGKEE